MQTQSNPVQFSLSTLSCPEHLWHNVMEQRGQQENMQLVVKLALHQMGANISPRPSHLNMKLALQMPDGVAQRPGFSR